MSARSSSSFCSQCGALLTPGASFCSQCGTAVGAEVASGRPEHRRRIEDLTVEGWEVKHDYGDRVVMIRREFGSIPLHVLLLVSTSGVGNILYAWYSYSPGADRIELRADGSEAYVSDENFSTDWTLRSAAAFIVSSVLGIFASVLGLFILLTDFGSVAALFGAVFLLLGLFSLALAPQHVPGFRSPTTFGTVRSTDERVVSEPTVPCTVCSGPVGTGVARRFAEKRYLAGIPVWTLNDGENHYCRSCARADFATITGKRVETEFA
ncbi:zinc ribbon domain-containing protein [Haladaptatus halobius]|uniref:zinc ribbon domain-containing protein n=1 Tax=Haladaptatus halobius TaxID=2884875 RepID=UPI001D0AC98B|nr:zinc ribbon domain-containing protein [Haladaptatus halobius]